jgi:hypothetical protein
MKPIVFISYAQVDEPEKPIDGEVRWLSFVRRHLQPAEKSGIFDVWFDRQMTGGADHDTELEAKLNACDIFILLVSPASMASDWVEKEIAIIRARQARGEPVHFYPLVLMPTPKAGLDKVMDKNLRPASAKPFSGCDAHDRARHMTDAADEIAGIAAEVAKRKRAALPAPAAGLARRSTPGKIAVSGPAMTAGQSVQAKSRYAAFVCYRHLPEDRRWAEWLIEALRDFETPEELVRGGVPSQIGTLFRDDKEMAVKADLAGYIRQALWDSEHLIVVCSAATPASDWVRAEISLFKHWGRAERIHALMIDAEVEQALPAELRYWRIVGKGPQAVMQMVEPAAASVAPVKGKSEAESKALARDKLAAALLGWDLAELRDALARRERALTTYGYFEQMVWRRAVPEGVGEVSPGDVPHREATLRFESRGGRVERVSRINGSGSLRDNGEGAAQWDVIWRTDGSVEAIELSDKLGWLVTRQRFNREATHVDFSTEAETAHAQGPAASVLSFVTDESKSNFGKSEIVRHLLDYDDNGYVIRRRYARDQFNTPAEDALGNWGEGYECDTGGLALRTWFLGQDGAQQTQRNGLNQITETFDAQARLLEQASFDSDGKPVLDKDFCARTTWAYDARGNVVEVAYFGVDGKPVLDKNEGYARRTISYDAHGNEIEWAYFGVDGEPVLHKDGNARFTKAYDARGNVIEWVYFGADGEPVLLKDGYARTTSAYDARGNAIEWACFGVDGKPVLDTDGRARTTRAYDARGKVIELVCFGVDGKPVLDKGGRARATWAYDARGNIIEWACFGVDGEPTLDKDGCARVTNAYDARGNVIESAYFGVDGEPVLHKDGNARFTKAYDARGNVIEWAYFGVDGEPALLKDGYARVTSAYDARGNVIEWAFFGVDGEPALHKDGCARVTNAYDARGNVIEWACFGVDGEPVLDKDGCARWTNVYDARGNRIEQTYFGLDGEPTLHKDGYARVTNAYDARGNEIEWAYFGIDGESVLHKDGNARFTKAYDARGNVIEWACFGVDGEPALDKDGCARWTNVYDARGNVIEQAYFGLDGEPTLHKDGYARVTNAYDAHGNVIEWAYFGVDGEPVLHKDGNARFTKAYDARGNVIEWAYFGVDGEPALHKDGCARVTNAYDARGNVIEWACFGVDGELVLDKDGCARWTNVYDARGNRIEQAYFGVDGEPTLHKDGYARVTNAYDARGNEIERAYFGVEGEPVLHKDGNARFTKAYDARGNVIEWACFGVDGEPVLLKDGYARTTKAYDTRGNVIEWACFGGDGKRVLDKDGCARWTNVYDARGNRIEQAYFGVDGAPIIVRAGYHKSRMEVDPLGRLLRVRYFGIVGEKIARRNLLLENDHIADLFGPWREAVLSGLLTAEEIEAVPEGGFHEALYAYDARGDVVERRFLDVHGTAALGPNGFSIEEIAYDALGRPVRFSPRRPDDNAHALSVAISYDTRGDAVAVEYLDQADRLVNGAQGFAKAELAYNQFGDVLSVRHLRADGTPFPADDIAVRATSDSLAMSK